MHGGRIVGALWALTPKRFNHRVGGGRSGRIGGLLSTRYSSNNGKRLTRVSAPLLLTVPTPSSPNWADAPALHGYRRTTTVQGQPPEYLALSAVYSQPRSHYPQRPLATIRVDVFSQQTLLTSKTARRISSRGWSCGKSGPVAGAVLRNTVLPLEK